MNLRVAGFLLLLMFPAAALPLSVTKLTVTPEAPTEESSVIVELQVCSGGTPEVIGFELRRSANTFQFILTSPGVQFAVPGCTEGAIPLGQLDAGRYDIEVLEIREGSTVAEVIFEDSFAVLPAAVSVPVGNLYVLVLLLGLSAGFRLKGNYLDSWRSRPREHGRFRR